MTYSQGRTSGCSVFSHQALPPLVSVVVLGFTCPTCASSLGLGLGLRWDADRRANHHQHGTRMTHGDPRDYPLRFLFAASPFPQHAFAQPEAVWKHGVSGTLPALCCFGRGCIRCMVNWPHGWSQGIAAWMPARS